jgi:molybdenum cofactor guanylyltransferase
MSGPRVDAIVLAGGASSRMGSDKALIELDGVPLLTRVVKAACGVAHVKRVLIVGRTSLPALGTAPPGRMRQPAAEIECRADEMPGLGPLGGVASGLECVRSEYALVLACDTPWLQERLLDALIERAPGNDAVVPYWDKKPQVLCAVYARSLLPLMRKLLDEGGRSLQSLLGQIPVLRTIDQDEVSRFDPSGLSFFNLNTPEELEQAERRVASSRSAASTP